MLFYLLADPVPVDASFAAKDPVFLHSEINYCPLCMDGDSDLGNG